MGIVGGELGYRIFRSVAKVSPGNEVTAAYDGQSKIEVLFGSEVWKEFADKTVLDFGCEAGVEAIDIARHGARRVVGLDLREDALSEARKAAEENGLADRCGFVTATDEKVDVVISLDAFEHFADPGAILGVMRKLLKEDGYVLTRFGPTWYHPLGGHGFSVFPWAHLIFTENVLMRWYSERSGTAARRFGEISGGLNQLTVRRFEELVEQSEFEFESFETVPIRVLRVLANRLTREFTTAVIKCKLVPRSTNTRSSDL